MTEDNRGRRGSLGSARDGGSKQKSTASKEDPTTVLRPSHHDRFPVGRAKAIMREILQEKLEGETFSSEHAKPIADEIRSQIRDLEIPRYKIMVQVLMGEQRGEGMRMGTRSLWDPMTDSYASETYTNDHLFCIATVFSVYLY
eukprot:gb/GECG01003317.1/.p1 GENE.gb/GECG01003317.1/~~gb/GECG01003317.1/.p1  ORF type:complete len:143 (+),score=14.40 gb/GECG01003317.1/:1-429(+)